MFCNGCATCPGPVMKIEETEDYQMLNELFERNGLEISADEPVSTDVIKGWAIKYTTCQEEELAGGTVLAQRQGEFIVDGIAVEEEHRSKFIGRIMLRLLKDEVAKRGGNKLYLVARAPEFFRKNGFETISREEAPEFFECFGCPQYQKTCHPEVMCITIE